MTETDYPASLTEQTSSQQIAQTVAGGASLRLRRRLQAAVLSPLVVAGFSSLGCLEDEKVVSRTHCYTLTAPESCATREELRSELSFPCAERLLSVDSDPTLTSSGRCCYDLTVEIGRECSSVVTAIPGRPLRSQQHIVLAASVSHSVWNTNSTPLNLQELTSTEQRGLAERWTKSGLYEPASVASFQRHALELMRWGAPATLVRLATQSALDEIEHASLCFALASAYAGKSIGPGKLPLGTKVDIAESLQQLALNVFEDGCINETLAALETELSQHTATAPEVRGVLATLARDEANHAELAWRTLSWICSQLDSEALAPLEASLTRHMQRAHAPLAAEHNCQPSAAERQHGELSGQQRQRLVQHTLQSVVAPCLGQLRVAMKTSKNTVSRQSTSELSQPRTTCS